MYTSGFSGLQIFFDRLCPQSKPSARKSRGPRESRQDGISNPVVRAARPRIIPRQYSVRIYIDHTVCGLRVFPPYMQFELTRRSDCVTDDW
jgi:hypothetical protein